MFHRTSKKNMQHPGRPKSVVRGAGEAAGAGAGAGVGDAAGGLEL